jgi:aspergillopepsin I
MVPAYYKFPCKGAKRLPDFYFKLPRTETLPGTAHILRIPGPYLKYAPIENDPKHCWGGLQSSETLQSPILGLAMLRALFVAFDIGKNRVGFANKRLHDHKWVVRNGSLS